MGIIHLVGVISQATIVTWVGYRVCGIDCSYMCLIYLYLLGREYVSRDFLGPLVPGVVFRPEKSGPG